MQLLKNQYAVATQGILSIKVEGPIKDANVFLAGVLCLVWSSMCADETPEENYRFSGLVKENAAVGSKTPVFPINRSSKEVQI